MTNLNTFLAHFCQHIGLEADQIKTDIEETDDQVLVSLQVPQEESGLFIGFHGETLNSLQRIIRVVFQESYPDKKIILNVNDYRQQRTEKMQELARTTARKVLDSGKQHSLSSLLPHERFVIHSTISNEPEFVDLESFSEGEEPYRVLVIRPKTK